ncbi:MULTISPECIES: cbb3-type cytochrome oxidase assembly protein [unclassified Frankia]|uniref:cbb3-type cytochrome oxidase assembly protein n=1 Tax=unclassified Frankia TaxID=2632575 RepID=UPI000871FAE1|nr:MULTISPECIES: cbb3-type cytochrome oxidase assembly protein [unclassified Frankia]OFB43222.1 hypothetical protein Manayef4_12185 [Frankia sp. CgIM4]
MSSARPARTAATRAWRRPSNAVRDPRVIDTVEVAWDSRGLSVELRGTLSQPTVMSSGAWAAFVAAVKRGEFDDLPSPREASAVPQSAEPQSERDDS